MTAPVQGPFGAGNGVVPAVEAGAVAASKRTDRRRIHPGWTPAVLQVGGLAGPGAAAGGVWVVARMQSDALAAAGAEVELVGGWLGTLPQEDPKPARPLHSNERSSGEGNSGEGKRAVAARLFRMRRPVPGAGLRAPVSFAFPRHVRKSAPAADVAHVHLCRDFVTCISTLLLGRAGTPVVAQTHGMLLPPGRRALRMFDRLITRRVLQIPALWLTLTEDEERGLARLGVDPGRFRRVVNATPEPGQTWSDPEKPVFLFAARLAPRKQPGVFVQAALEALAAGLDARFVVAGPDQGEAAKVQAVIADSGYADRFELVGELGPAEVRERMAGCTAYVLPALSEPYPMTVLEAAALGAPVILTEQCGLAALMDRQEAAVVVEPSVPAVREAMLRLAGDRAERERIGRNALLVHRENWSTEALAQDLLDAYRGAAGLQGGQP